MTADLVTSADLGDPRYPARLRRLGAEAPPRVWWRGLLPAPDVPAMTVVGSRTPDEAAVAATRRAVDLAVAAGLVVVSGLSPGVDALAHRRCVERGGRGLAVVGGGVDVAEDDALAALADALVDGGGGVLAERPPGHPVDAAGRAARCRIQVVLGDEVVVTAFDGPQDGTLHAIRAARAWGVPLVDATGAGG